jgi:hypothetical protein
MGKKDDFLLDDGAAKDRGMFHTLKVSIGYGMHSHSSTYMYLKIFAFLKLLTFN